MIWIFPLRWWDQIQAIFWNLFFFITNKHVYFTIDYVLRQIFASFTCFVLEKMLSEKLETRINVYHVFWKMEAKMWKHFSNEFLSVVSNFKITFVICCLCSKVFFKYFSSLKYFSLILIILTLILHLFFIHSHLLPRLKLKGWLNTNYRSNLLKMPISLVNKKKCLFIYY